MTAAPDFVVNYHYHGLSLVAAAQYANAYGNDATTITNDAERVAAAMPPNAPAGLRAQIVGPIRTIAARLLLAHGESPDNRLREARELLLQAIQDDPVKVSPRLDLVDVELARIDWAMAQGKIVLASDVGGHRELIEDGVTGTLFAPDDPKALADALAGLFARRDQWEERRKVARAFVEKDRNWSSNISCYAPVYHKLTGLPV